MKEQLAKLYRASQIGGLGDAVAEAFGLDSHAHYDVLVAAPAWKPTKILPKDTFTAECTAEHSYFSGYEVQCDGLRIGWIQTASGGCNLIDQLSICCEMDFDKLVFLGAVGGLVRGFEIGDVCTPSFSIDGGMARAYLSDDIRSYRPLEKVFPHDRDFIERVIRLAAQEGVTVKPASVFCTDSIFGEYTHLDFIKSLGAELIEMETAAFYHMAALLEKPAIALLAVSDNSATDNPLMGRSGAQQARYNIGRKQLIPRLLVQIGKMACTE